MTTRVFDRSEWIAVQFWGHEPCSYCGDPGNWACFTREEPVLTMRLCRYHAVILGFEDPPWNRFFSQRRPVHLPYGNDRPGPRAMGYMRISRLLRRLQRDKLLLVEIEELDRMLEASIWGD